MGNISNFNVNKIDMRLSNANYWDLYLADGDFSVVPKDSILSGDCLVAHYDFNENEIFENGSLDTIYSLTLWNDATNTGYTMNTVGLTGIDNGLITFDKPPCDTTNQALLSALTGTTLVIPSGDTRLVLNQVTGMTGNYGYPISLVDSGDDIGVYSKLCGGFYQGYYKLDGNSYEVLPNRVPKEWTAEFWLRNSCYDQCETIELVTDLSITGATKEVVTTLSGHNLTTDDVISINAAGDAFDITDIFPFYKVTNVVDENTFLYGINNPSLFQSSDIGYVGRFVDNFEVSGVSFTHNYLIDDIGITVPTRFYFLSTDNFRIGDMISYDMTSGDGGSFRLQNHYTSYITNIVGNGYYEVHFGDEDEINDLDNFTANITRYVEDGCNVEYEMYSNVGMTKEASGNTITTTLINHGLVTGDTLSIYNADTGFTTDKIYSYLLGVPNSLLTPGFAVITVVIDENTFQFEHHYLNDNTSISTSATVLLYEEDFTENIFVDDRDTGGNDDTFASYSIECVTDNLILPIKVDIDVFDLTPTHRKITYSDDDDDGDWFIGYGYTSPKEILDDEFEYSGDKVSFPSSGYADITFYKPKKKIPLTLNDTYPENRGIFFYLGTRAENKFWNIFDGLNTGETSGCTGSDILNTSVNYVTNGDFSSGTEGNTPDGWTSSAWIKQGDSAWIGTSGPPTISIPISQDLTTSLSSCSYQLMFNIDEGGGDNITFSTNLSGITEVFTSGGTGLTYNFDLTDEDTPVSAITFTINGSDYVSGQISNVRIYAFDKANDWCTIPKETEISVMDDNGNIIPLSPPPIDLMVTDNKFLFFSRAVASGGGKCGRCGGVHEDGFTTCTWTGGTDGSVTIRTVRTEVTDERNPFSIFSRARDTTGGGCNRCGGSHPAGETVCTYSGRTAPVLELDRDADLIDNALAFRITDDGAIGYRKLIVTAQTIGDVCITGCTIEESYSASGMVTCDQWKMISIRFVANETLDECELTWRPARKGKLMFYVNRRLIHVVDEFEEFIARRLLEHSVKQVAVPYNISIGGGTQALIESMTFDGQDPDDMGSCLQNNFAGTFIGDISQFRFYICGMNYCEIKNNFEQERERYGLSTND